MKRKWYVAYTKPRNEKKVAERLTSYGYEVYCPIVKTLKQWSDRKKTVRLPMFTSYIFALLNENERQEVIQDPGILNFVHWQGTPAIVRDSEIESIRKIESYGLEIEVSEIQPVKGELVVITEGPFKRLTGEVRKIDKNRLSVWIEALKSLVTFNYEIS